MKHYQTLKQTRKTILNRRMRSSKKPSRMHWSLSVLFVLTLSVVASCGGGSSDGNDPGNGNGGDFNKSALIANSANIMKAGVGKLNNSVPLLKASIDAYCTARDPAKRTDAQTAFKVAMNDLQSVMLYQLGPALDDSNMKKLYSWPTTNICEIDKKLAQNITTLQTPINRRGMDALEYLLFVEPAMGHSCPTGTRPITELAAFNALSNTEREERRCAFMKPVVADVVSSTQALASGWESHVNVMTSSSNTQTILNEITDAMYFFREDLREFKLGRPLNGTIGSRTPSCGIATVCPADVESRHSGHSKENIRVNTLAFKELYLGGAGGSASIGFDDWLREVGSPDVATKFIGEIDAVLAKIEAVNGSLFDAISSSSDIGSAKNLLDAVERVSKTFRFDVLPALNLTPPAGLVSDTD